MELKFGVFLPLKVLLFSLIFFKSLILFADGLEQNNMDYLELAKGLPMEFEYTRNFEILDGAIIVEDLTFKSVKPSHIDDNGDKWFERFYFSTQKYVSEKLAKGAFDDSVIKYTKGEHIATKCPYYSIREKDIIYSIYATCGFNWKIDRLVKNLKRAFIKNENELSEAIRCKSGGHCWLIDNANSSK